MAFCIRKASARQEMKELRETALRRPDPRTDFRELLEMFRVPGVDDVRLGFDRATGQQRVVDSATDDGVSGSGLNERDIFLSRQRNHRQVFQNIIDKKQRFVAIHPMPIWKAGNCGIKLRQGMCATTSVLVAPLEKCRFTGQMVFMLASVNRNQDRSIEE